MKQTENLQIDSLSVGKPEFHLNKMQDQLADMFCGINNVMENSTIANAYANVVMARLDLRRWTEGK